jgi:hypothetical protein
MALCLTDHWDPAIASIPPDYESHATPCSPRNYVCVASCAKESDVAISRLMRMALLVSAAALGLAPLGVDSATCAIDAQKSCAAADRAPGTAQPMADSGARLPLGVDQLSLDEPLKRQTIRYPDDVANPQRATVERRHTDELLLSAPQRPLTRKQRVDPFAPLAHGPVNSPSHAAEPLPAVQSAEAAHDTLPEPSVAWPLLLGLLMLILRRAPLGSYPRGLPPSALHGSRHTRH